MMIVKSDGNMSVISNVMKHKPSQQVVVPPTDLPLLSQLELVQTFGTGSASSRCRRFSTIDQNRWKQFYQPSYISEFLIHDLQPRAKGGVFALRKTDVLSALLLSGHVGVAWKLIENQYTSGNRGLSSHSEETKKGKVF